MSNSPDQRKLAALMFTDMVGYSILAQRDEVLALQLLEEHRQIVRALLPKHQGKEIKNTGDGFLIEFSSALAAVQCAVEIQQTLTERNRIQFPERQFNLRIGIHLGDVVETDGDLYGDGVNIAARIEPLAEPGGICLSSAIFQQIENKVKFPLVKLETPELKNIQSRVEVYKLLLDTQKNAVGENKVSSQPTPTLSPTRRHWQLVVGLATVVVVSVLLFQKFTSPSKSAAMPQKVSTSAPVSEKASVAVLPFVNMSADKDNEYLSDGITEELLNALGKVPGLRVPARTSAFAFKGKNEDIRKIGELLSVRHVLEGSVRKAGNRLRITVKLISVSDSFQLWSETYDRELKDVFDLEEEIARTIVAKLKVTLAGEASQPTIKRQENIEAWQLYLKGQFYSYRYTEESQKRAIAYFKQVLEKQPDSAQAYTGLASAYDILQYFGYFSPEEARPLINMSIIKALELDSTLSEAHVVNADKKLYYDWDWSAAEQEYKRAIELNPSSLDTRFKYSDYLTSMGRFEEALAQNSIAQLLDPLNPTIKLQEGYILDYQMKSERALEAFGQAKAMDANLWGAYEQMGYVLFRKGKRAEGIAEMEAAVRLDSALRPLAALGRMYAQIGRKKDAHRILHQLLKWRKSKYVNSFYIAEVYKGLGDFAQANIWINEAIKNRESQLVFMKVFPDDLNRVNPYFPEWLKKVGL